jgi:hypothetical protein
MKASVMWLEPAGTGRMALPWPATARDHRATSPLTPDGGSSETKRRVPVLELFLPDTP